MSMHKNVLITCKTYPQPSISYQETVCTAGIDENGNFIRLYPIEFRALPFSQQFQKYQWVSLRVKKSRNDPRPESYRPDLTSISLGQKIGTQRNWEMRRQYILAHRPSLMCDLSKQSQSMVSLGIVKPRQIIKFYLEDDPEPWTQKQLNALRQNNLFSDNNQKPLEKIPVRFKCKYLCEHPDCKGHDQSIIDWEFYQLFRKQFAKFTGIDEAKNSVINKFTNDIAGLDVDTHFFVGTVLSHSSWLIIGTFYPKIDRQGKLF